MKIAVFGWYGHDNAGDERIKYCLSTFLKGLGGIDHINFYDLHEEAIKGATSKFDDYNLVIIGGGGLILSRHNYHDFILSINTKMVTLGISVETPLKGNPKKFAEALLEKSEIVLVRDSESYRKMKSLDLHNKVMLGVDITFLAPYDLVTDTQDSNTIAINLMIKTQYNPISLMLRSHLSRFSKCFLPKPICFKDLINDLDKRYTLVPIPLFCKKKPSNASFFQGNDVIFLQESFKKVSNTFQHTTLDKCDMFLSMRLHGLIFSAQKGIPFTTFETYPKQKNFMKEVGLDDLSIDLDHIHQAKPVISKIIQNKSIIKEKILTYRTKAVEKSQEDLIRIMSHVLK